MTSKKNLNGLNYYYQGNILNNAIVFLHGNSLNARSFIRQFETIKDKPLIAIDLPGHGLSFKPHKFEEIYCLPGYVNALRCLISDLGIRDYILAGHSLGGHIAIEACNELDSIKGLAIFGTPPVGNPPEMDKMFLPNPEIGSLFKAELNEKEASVLSNELIHSDLNVASTLKEMILSTDENCRTNLGASIGKGLFKNEKEILENIKIPVVVLHGKHEKIISKNYISNINFPKLWKKEIHEISNSGHCPQLENPVEFNSVLTEFYDDII